MHEFMTFLMYTSMKQMHFSRVVIDLEGSTDDKHTEDLFSVLFFPPQFLCRSRNFSG